MSKRGRKKLDLTPEERVEHDKKLKHLWYEKNKQKVIDQAKRWHQDNPEKAKEYHEKATKRYGQSEKGKITRRNNYCRKKQKWLLENKDKIRTPLTLEERKERKKEYDRNWSINNSDKKKESYKKDYENNRERYAENAKRRYLLKREEILKSYKEYYQKNKERVKEVQRGWHEKYPDYRKEYYKKVKEKKNNDGNNRTTDNQ